MDLTSRNISDYLVKTYPSLIRTRWKILWSGFIFDVVRKISVYCSCEIVFSLQLEEQILGE